MVRCSNRYLQQSLWVSTNEKLSDFSASSWQHGDSPVGLLVVRLCLASASVGILAWAVCLATTPYWLIYLTNWGLVLLSMVTLSGLCVSFAALSSDTREKDAEVPLPWYVSVYWFLFNVTISTAFLITLLYWVLLFDPVAIRENGISHFYLEIVTHGVNSVIALTEVLASRTPVRLMHIYQPLGLGLWYAAFSYIYYAAGGTDPMGNPFIYEVLSWDEPARTGIVVGASTGGLIMIYLVLYGVAFCRDRLFLALFRSTSHDLAYMPSDDMRRGIV